MDGDCHGRPPYLLYSPFPDKPTPAQASPNESIDDCVSVLDGPCHSQKLTRTIRSYCHRGPYCRHRECIILLWSG